MDRIEAAVLECDSCECPNVYTGPLTVGDALCECGHPLKPHRIAIHGVPVDPETGAVPEGYEIAPRFR
jgi:hypothetical protein